MASEEPLVKVRVHDLKCWPEPFDACVAGTKRHEFRRDDRGFAVGDVLLLNKWDPSNSKSTHVPVGYMGAHAWFRVTYLGRGFGIPEGFVCMSIERCAAVPGFYVGSYTKEVPHA